MPTISIKTEPSDSREVADDIPTTNLVSWSQFSEENLTAYIRDCLSSHISQRIEDALSAGETTVGSEKFYDGAGMPIEQAISAMQGIYAFTVVRWRSLCESMSEVTGSSSADVKAHPSLQSRHMSDDAAPAPHDPSPHPQIGARELLSIIEPVILELPGQPKPKPALKSVCSVVEAAALIRSFDSLVKYYVDTEDLRLAALVEEHLKLPRQNIADKLTSWQTAAASSKARAVNELRSETKSGWSCWEKFMVGR